MCTNNALLDSIECYMDELVECFEDFIKRSLWMLTLGVLTVIAMFVFMVRKMMDRGDTGDPPNTDFSVNRGDRIPYETGSSTTINGYPQSSTELKYRKPYSGVTSSTGWSNGNYGASSNSMGRSNTQQMASGYQSGASGYQSGTPGYQSGAPGYQSGAPGYQASAPGYQASAPGYQSGAPGYQASAPGYQSGAPGYQASAPGYQAGAPGYQSGGPGYRSGTTLSTTGRSTSNNQHLRMSTSTQSDNNIRTQNQSSQQYSKLSFQEDYGPQGAQNYASNEMNAVSGKALPSSCSLDRESLKEAEISCSKSCPLAPQPMPTSMSRLTIPSLNPPCFRKQMPNQYIKVLRRSSCCSMCCHKDKKCT